MTMHRMVLAVLLAAAAPAWAQPLSELPLADEPVPLLRDRLRLRGFERAARFTWDRTAREMLASYRAAAG